MPPGWRSSHSSIGLRDGAEIFQQRRRLGIERPEDESAVAVHARHLRHVEFRILEVAGIAIRPRHGAQLAGIEKAPAVIGACEETRRALLLAAERGAAMGAAVEQRADLALRVTQQNDRPQPQPDSDEIVIVRDLAVVPEIDPHRAEDVGHLRLENGRIGIDQPMDAIVLHQLVPVVPLGPAVRRAVMPCSNVPASTVVLQSNGLEKIEIFALLPLRGLAGLLHAVLLEPCAKRPVSLRLSLRK